MVDTMSAREYREAQARPKRRKYGNVSVVIDGIRFDSKLEGDRYLELREMQRRGEIRGLKCHPKFVLQAAFRIRGKWIREITYKADFEYEVCNSCLYGGESLDAGDTVIEEVKSKATKTQAWRLRWKMLMYQYRNQSEIHFVVFE